MDYRRVDAIMKQVEQHYRGEFSVNGNREDSLRLARLYREQDKKKFNGFNGRFDTGKMFCTESCTREENTFVLPSGGLVYGPYFTFAPGDYDAQFDLAGDLSACTLTAFSQTLGTLTSGEASALTKTGRIVLPFSLSAEVNDLELKALNHGNGQVVFKDVIVSSRNEASWNIPPKASVSAQEGDIAVKCEGYEKLAEELEYLQMYSSANGQELLRAAECELPEHTRLRGVKVFFRKLLNSFIVFQVDFNKKIGRSIQALSQQMKGSADILAKLLHRQQDCETQVQALTQRVEAQQKQILQMQAEHSANTGKTSKEEIAAIEQSRTEIGQLWAKIHESDEEFRNIWEHEKETNANLNSVWQTYGTFRQEIFYELDRRIRESSGKAGPSSVTEPSPEPVVQPGATEKIKQAGGKVRLNLGSGGLSVEDYLSVDARNLPNVDIVADVSKLPYEPETVDEIFSAHLIEHFPRMVMEKELLPYWRSLLKEGGTFRVIFPDLEAMIQAYNAGQMNFEQLGKVIMGGQDYQLDYHYAVYSPDTVTEMLKAVGYKDIRIVARGRENGGCKETEITAVK